MKRNFANFKMNSKYRTLSQLLIGGAVVCCLMILHRTLYPSTEMQAVDPVQPNLQNSLAAQSLTPQSLTPQSLTVPKEQIPDSAKSDSIAESKQKSHLMHTLREDRPSMTEQKTSHEERDPSIESLQKEKQFKNTVSTFTDAEFKNLQIQYPEAKEFKELALIGLKKSAHDEPQLKSVDINLKKPTPEDLREKEQIEITKIKAEMGAPAPIDRLKADLYDPWAQEYQKIVTQEERHSHQLAQQALEARKAEAKRMKQRPRKKETDTK